MVNYQLSKIYKIVADETQNVYIGATNKKLLCQRMSHHRSALKNAMPGHLHDSANEILKYASAQIVLIELFPCNSKDELIARKRFHIVNTPNCVNVNFRVTPEEKAVQVCEAGKRYHAKHRDELKEIATELIKCECGVEISRGGISAHKKTRSHNQLMEWRKMEEDKAREAANRKPVAVILPNLDANELAAIDDFLFAL